MLLGTPELVTRPKKQTAAQRRRQWSLVDTLMLGYLTSLTVAAAVLYAASEHYFYFWDYAVYQDITAHVSEGFRVSIGEGLARIRASLSNDYNALFTMPIVPIARMFGADRPIFLGSLALFYQVPFILAVAAVSRQIFWGDPRRVFWIAALTTVLVPPLWAPMLRGYPDPGGATLVLVAAWLYLTSLRKGGSLRRVASAGVCLAAAMLFRRHYIYGAIAFFLTVLAYRVIVIVQAYRHRPARAGAEVRGAAMEIAVLSATTTVTLVIFGSAFLRYLMASNYYTLYESFLNPPLTNLDYFIEFFGGGLCVAAGAGWVVTWRTHAARRAPAMFCMLFGVVSVLLWVLAVRQVGTHLGLHLTLLVMPGLVGLVLAGSRLRPHSVRLAFLTCAAGFLILNMLQALSPWVPPPGWPNGTVFSDRHPALARPDDKEVQRLVGYLRSLARPTDPVYVEGSTATMNYDVLLHADRTWLPMGGPSLMIQTVPQIDSRDWYPIEELVKARLVVINSPLQVHLDPKEQDLVRLSHDIFTRDWEFADDFSATPERFRLQKGVEARVFVRQRDTDLGRSLRLMRDMRHWMKSRPLGPAPAWVIMTPHAYWADASKAALRVTLGPHQQRQAVLYSNADWRGTQLTVSLTFEGPSSAVRLTASAVDLETGLEQVLDSQVVEALDIGATPITLEVSPEDATKGSLMLSLEPLSGSPLVVLSDLHVR